MSGGFFHIEPTLVDQLQTPAEKDLSSARLALGAAWIAGGLTTMFGEETIRGLTEHPVDKLHIASCAAAAVAAGVATVWAGFKSRHLSRAARSASLVSMEQGEVAQVSSPTMQDQKEITRLRIPRGDVLGFG